MKKFWDKVNIGKIEDCWEWTAGRKSNNYGHFSIGGRKNKRQHNSSRFAYEFHYGFIVPRHLFVLHKCDNPPCCNPHHLFLGTPKDNTKDMFSKNRQGKNQPKGEKHNKAKLTEDKVRQIRKLYESTPITQIKLGEQFNVVQSVIGAIVNNKLWTHVK